MYCVMGEKILRCEVKKKEEMSSICKMSTSNKEQRVANNRLFETEEEAAEFIKERKKNKANENKQVAHAVEVCKALYERLYEETGIEVRTIDREWTVNSAEKHIMKLKRTLLDRPETHGKNVSKSFGKAPDPKKENKRFSPKRVSKSSDKDQASRNRGSEKKYSNRDDVDEKQYDRGDSYRSDSQKRKSNSKNYTRSNTQGSSKGNMKNSPKNNGPRNNSSRNNTYKK